MKLNSKRLSIFLSVLFFVTAFFACKASTEVHEHTYDSAWTSDESNHWYAATCEHTDAISDKTAHSFGEPEVTDPVCGTAGQKVSKCTVCNYVKTEVIPATGDHSWSTETVPATEKAPGKITRTCTICKTVETEDIPQLEHKHTFATAWTKNETKHWHAATCEHSEEVSDNAAHTYGNGEASPAATCGSAGTKYYTCSVCGYYYTEEIPATGNHTWDSGKVTVEATEETKGVKTYTCTVCKTTKTEDIDKLPHTHKYSADWSKDDIYHWHAATCGDTTEKSDNAKHTFNAGEITTAATCGAKGVKTYTCTVCTYQKTEDITATGSHTWDSGKVTTAPTEAETGVMTYTCINCPATKTEPISKLDHVHTYSDTWTDDIDYHWHASTCGHNDAFADKTAHEFGSGSVTKTATCTETGVKTYTCAVCKRTKTETIAARGHSYSDEWSKDQTNHWHAATCGHTDQKSDVTAHTFDSGKITKQPTCSETGIKTYTCTVCSAVKTEDIAKIDHTYSANWTKDETNHWHAATCGHSDLVSDKASHTFDAGTITTPATCGVDGVRTYTCTVCGQKKTAAVSATGNHTWNSGEITTAATEETKGVKTYTCTVCKATKTEDIDKLPHTHKYSSLWTSDETYHWHASTCGHNSEISGKAEHTFDSGTVTTEATTTSTGIKTYTCTVCKATKLETIPMKEVVPELTSVEFAKTLVIGWNLGNALDASACADWAYSEGNNLEYSWLPHKVPASQNLIKAVKAAGFETIRIPISWHNHMNRYDTTNYTIDSSWMKRVKELVDWSLAENMKVIINIHHDNLTESEISNNPGFVLSTNTAYQTKSKNYISKVWTQIANTFKDYDNNLIFEVLNEPRCIEADWEWGFYSSETQAYAKTYCDIITEYEQSGLDAIRATGGNNATRYVMVPGYAASPFYLSYYTLPVDSASDKLLLSTHAYTPNDFALEGDMTDYDSNKTYIESSIDSVFSDLYRTYVKTGRGVVMGEASASDKNNTSSRVKWATYYFAKAKAAGIPIVVWDNEQSVTDGATAGGENHGYFNRSTCAQYYPTIITAMMNGAASDAEMEDYGLMDGPLDLTSWSVNTTIPASRFTGASSSATLVLTLEKATGYSSDSGIIKIQDEWSTTVLEYTETVSLPGTFRYTPTAAQWTSIKTHGLIIYGNGPKVVYLAIE